MLAAYRRELHIHCYRLLANFEEAEDAVQETLTKAWQARDNFGAAGNARAWLYRIATNVCLDRMRQVKTLDRSFAEVPWLQPYPDALLDEPAELVDCAGDDRAGVPGGDPTAAAAPAGGADPP